MEELMNFAAPQGEFSPAVVTKEIVEAYKYQPLDNAGGALLVLKPEISEYTKSGLKKADSQIADELKKMDYPMTVLSASQICKEFGVKEGSQVVVNRFTQTNLPSPLEGFDVVLVRLHEVLAFDKTVSL